MKPTEILDRLRGLRVLVVGDLILDRYISVVPDRISQVEDNIVFKRTGEEMFIGGAGIVAAHCASLGATTSLVTLFGNDDLSGIATYMLRQAGVDVRAVMDIGGPPPRRTTLKERHMSRSGRVVHREDWSSTHEADAPVVARIVDAVEARLNGADATNLLLFADFGLRTLPQLAVDLITAAARDYGVMTAADSQAASDTCDIARYLQMDLITPTEKEARLAMDDWRSPLPDLAKNIQAYTLARDVVITLAEDGVYVEPRVGEGKYIPALNKAPRDVVGAGDALFATTAMALCVGADIWEAARFGSIAAAVQVGRLGNVPLTVGDILAWTALESAIHEFRKRADRADAAKLVRR